MKPGERRGTAAERQYFRPIHSILKPHVNQIISPLPLLLSLMFTDWDRLGSEYADSSVLIGDVDCTADGESLCEEYEIRGYPTIKYFKDGDSRGEDYQGGRDFDSLKQFVEDELEVKCSVEDPSECSDKEKAYIEKMKAKSAEERSAQLARLDGMSGGKMKAELRRWLGQRIRILKQLDENKDANDEF